MAQISSGRSGLIITRTYLRFEDREDPISFALMTSPTFRVKRLKTSSFASNSVIAIASLLSHPPFILAARKEGRKPKTRLGRKSAQILTDLKSRKASRKGLLLSPVFFGAEPQKEWGNESNKIFFRTSAHSRLRPLGLVFFLVLFGRALFHFFHGFLGHARNFQVDGDFVGDD